MAINRIERHEMPVTPKEVDHSLENNETLKKISNLQRDSLSKKDATSESVVRKGNAKSEKTEHPLAAHYSHNSCCGNLMGGMHDNFPNQ